MNTRSVHHRLLVLVLLLASCTPALMGAPEWWKANEQELRAAAKDTLPAAVELAMRQFDGRVVSFDKTFMLETFRRGSAADIPLAHTGLALCHLNGIGMEMNHDPVFGLLEKAAAKNEPKGMYYFGLIQMRVARDQASFDLGLEWVRKAAQTGSPEARMELASVLLHGPPKQRNEGKAIAELQRLADQQENKYAAYVLGEYYRGEEQKKPELAKKYLKMAAAKNHSNSLVALGDMAMNNGGWNGNKQARKEAAEWYRKAIARNSAPGMRKLATMQMRDTSIRKTGEEWYQMLLDADKAGDGEATLTLAKIHYHAPGYTFRDLDWSKSAHYHERFIRERRGTTDFHVSLHALFELHYKGGLGLDRNYDKCLELAAEYIDECHMAARYAGLILLRPDAPKGNTREHFIRGYACMLKYQQMEGKTDEHTLFLLRSRHGMTKEEIDRAKELFRNGFPNSRTPLLP